MKKRIEQQSSTSQPLLCRTEYETEFHTAFWCDKRAPDILGHPEPITGCCHFPAGAWETGNGSPCAGLIVHERFQIEHPAAATAHEVGVRIRSRLVAFLTVDGACG